MLPISQPFSFPGPTRMSHRKRNLSELSVLARKGCNRSTPTPIEPVLLRRGHQLCVWRDGAREFFAEPQRWTFRAGLVLG